MTGSTALPASARRVQAALDAGGFDCRVVVQEHSARTAAEAADALGCAVAQIVKSLVFRGAESGAGILVAVSGANRVREDLLAEAAGEPIGRADANFVREVTGFAIGGVPPLAHAQGLKTFLDRDLFELDTLWAAGGTPRALFCLTPADLSRMTAGRIIAVKS